MPRILSKRDYEKILHDKEKLLKTLSEDGVAYNVIPMLICYIEGIRKSYRIVTNSDLKSFVNIISDGSYPEIADIQLTSSDISNAINDEDFILNEIGKRQNPYYLSSKIAVEYRSEDEIWWDADELLDQLREIYDGDI